MTQESGQDAQAGKTRRRWLWITLYVVGLLLLLEAGARLTWRVIDTSWGLVVPQDVSRFDPVYGWSLKPGACSVSKATGRPVEYKINSHGLRGPEIAYDKPAGTSRIVLLGDSHAFGFGVPESYHFASLLEGYLPGVQVVNLGVNGYGIAQELLYLTREGFKYHPDLVIAYVPHYADWRHLRDMALPYHIYVLATAGTEIDKTRPLQYGTALVLIVLVLGMVLNQAPLHPRAILESITETFAPLSREKGVPIVCHVGQDVPITVIGDELRVRQILFNLAGNAMPRVPPLPRPPWPR